MGCGTSTQQDLLRKQQQQNQGSQQQIFTVQKKTIKKSQNKHKDNILKQRLRRQRKEGQSVDPNKMQYHDEEEDERFREFEVETMLYAPKPELPNNAESVKKNVKFYPVENFNPSKLGTLLLSEHGFQSYSELKSKNGKKQFTDPEFPPDLSSIVKDPVDMPKAKHFKWKRAKDIFDFGRLKVFQKRIEPNDIFQGQLGDCYFLSALSILAERPNLIDRNFLQRDKNDEGLYGVLLCIDGEFKEIIIDDHFPVDENGKPAFSQSNDEDAEEFGDELWVLLMEKAYAKAFGSYHNIVAGATGQAVKDICGAPYEKVKSTKGADVVWKFICEHDDVGHMMSAGSGGQLVDGKEMDRGKGILSGHAYAILDHREVQRDGTERLVQLRNPWGTKEWEGDWSDKSEKWTDKIKKELDFVEADDGVFWIEMRDFIREFDDVVANVLNEDYLYQSLKVKLPTTNMALVKFHVQYDETHVYLQLTQKDERHYHKTGVYKYSLAKLIVVKSDFKTFVGEKITTLRDLSIEANLDAGSYYAFVEMQWGDKKADCDFVVFSAYSSDPVQIEPNYKLMTDEDADMEILDEMLLMSPPENPAKIKTYDGAKEIQRYTSMAFGYFFFAFVNNHSKSTLSEVVNVKEPQNLQICPPFNNPTSWTIDVQPGERKIVRYRITSPTGGDFYYKAGYGGGISKSDDQLIEEVKTQGAGDRKRRGDHEVFYYPYYYNQGYLLLHWNQDKADYEEELELRLTNLELDGKPGEKTPVLNLLLKPGEFKLHKLNIIDKKQEFFFKTSLWYELKN